MYCALSSKKQSLHSHDLYAWLTAGLISSDRSIVAPRALPVICKVKGKNKVNGK
jgi:hypothetical protein